jgi:hypothetical protein
MDLPRFGGQLRAWDQGIWSDGILPSCLVSFFCSAPCGAILPSRPARWCGRRVQRRSRTGRPKGLSWYGAFGVKHFSRHSPFPSFQSLCSTLNPVSSPRPTHVVGPPRTGWIAPRRRNGQAGGVPFRMISQLGPAHRLRGHLFARHRPNLDRLPSPFRHAVGVA